MTGLGERLKLLSPWTSGCVPRLRRALLSCACCHGCYFCLFQYSVFLFMLPAGIPHVFFFRCQRGGAPAPPALRSLPFRCVVSPSLRACVFACLFSSFWVCCRRRSPRPLLLRLLCVSRLGLLPVRPFIRHAPVFLKQHSGRGGSPFAGSVSLALSHVVCPCAIRNSFARKPAASKTSPSPLCV